MKAEILALSWIIVIPLTLVGLALWASRRIARGGRPDGQVSAAATGPSIDRSNADVERLLTEAIELTRAKRGIRSP